MTLGQLGPAEGTVELFEGDYDIALTTGPVWGQDVLPGSVTKRIWFDAP